MTTTTSTRRTRCSECRHEIPAHHPRHPHNHKYICGDCHDRKCEPTLTPRPLPAKGERKNIIAPPDHWAAWRVAADADSLSVSEWVGRRCNAGLAASVVEGLSKRLPQGQPRKTTSEMAT